MNSIFVTVPVSVRGLSLSNSTENPWCAKTSDGAESRHRARKAAADEMVLKIAPRYTTANMFTCITEGFARSSPMISQEGVSAHYAVVRQPLLTVRRNLARTAGDSQEWLSHIE